METRWNSGDGGPLVVLQAGAVAAWDGAGDFERSLMGGGSVETDYDVICRCADGVSVIRCHDRDMLVLCDSEWVGCFTPSERHEVAVVQSFGSDDAPGSLPARLTVGKPSEVLRFSVIEPTLRLLVGSDSGDGGVYGFVEHGISPGIKVCEVYCFGEAQIITLRPA